MGMARKLVNKQSSLRTWMLRLVAFLIAGFGFWAFIKRQIGSYMLLRNQFVFFDFEEPLALFLADYIAVMGLFVMIGHRIFLCYGYLYAIYCVWRKCGKGTS